PRVCVVDVGPDGKPLREPQCQSYTVSLTACPDGDGCLVFASGVGYGGNLGGLAGGDALCQAGAAARRLPGTYRAWLSDGTNSPSTRFARSKGPYVQPDGIVIARSWNDLTDGSLQNGIKYLGPESELILTDPVLTGT